MYNTRITLYKFNSWVIENWYSMDDAQLMKIEEKMGKGNTECKEVFDVI